MRASLLSAYEVAASRLPAVCPTAPPGAQAHVDKITGYVLWAVLAFFVIGLVVGVGGIVAGRVFQMQHASKAGVVGIAVVFAAALSYLVLPPILGTMLGSGCV